MISGHVHLLSILSWGILVYQINMSFFVALHFTTRVHEFSINHQQFIVIKTNKVKLISQPCPIGKTVKSALKHRKVKEDNLEHQRYKQERPTPIAIQKFSNHLQPPSLHQLSLG